jgi:hypothetical protein
MNHIPEHPCNGCSFAVSKPATDVFQRGMINHICVAHPPTVVVMQSNEYKQAKQKYEEKHEFHHVYPKPIMACSEYNDCCDTYAGRNLSKRDGD